MSIFFPGGHPFDLIKTVGDLADDLASLSAGRAPSDLANAPLLSDWTVATRPHLVLSGRATDHPLLGNSAIFTSEVHAIDLDAGWVRTWSRFYRLDASLADAGRFQ